MVFDLLYNFDEKEKQYLNDVLQAIHEKYNGTVHVSFDYQELIDGFHNGETIDDVLKQVEEFSNAPSRPATAKDFGECDFATSACSSACECYTQ